MRMLSKLWRRFRGNERGTSTIEFVMILPGFLAILLVGYESGMMMVRNVLLERGVDLAVRDLRLGTPTPPTFEELRTTICRESMLIEPEDCADTIQVQLEPVDLASWATFDSPARCIDQTADIDPIDDTTYLGGGNNQLMLVRVCSLYRPMFAPTGWGMQMPNDGNGNYALVVTTAFVNEPTR